MAASTSPPARSGPATGLATDPRTAVTGAAGRRVLRTVRRAFARHRPLLTAGLLVVAAASLLLATRPPAPPAVGIAVAAHDLVPGRPLGPGDVGTIRLDPDLVPTGTYRPDDVPLGALVAGPVRAGEPITDVAVVGPGLASGLPPEQVLATIRVRDPAAALVRTGDVVRVVATDPRGASSAEVVAPEATVVTVPDEDAAGISGTDGTSALVVAVTESEALVLSGAATTRVLDILVPPLAPG